MWTKKCSPRTRRWPSRGRGKPSPQQPSPCPAGLAPRTWQCKRHPCAPRLPSGGKHPPEPLRPHASTARGLAHSTPWTWRATRSPSPCALIAGVLRRARARAQSRPRCSWNGRPPRRGQGSPPTSWRGRRWNERSPLSGRGRRGNEHLPLRWRGRRWNERSPLSGRGRRRNERLPDRATLSQNNSEPIWLRRPLITSKITCTIIDNNALKKMGRVLSFANAKGVTSPEIRRGVHLPRLEGGYISRD